MAHRTLTFDYVRKPTGDYISQVFQLKKDHLRCIWVHFHGMWLECSLVITALLISEHISIVATSPSAFCVADALSELRPVPINDTQKLRARILLSFKKGPDDI